MITQLGGSQCFGISSLSSITAGLCRLCQSHMEGEVGMLPRFSRKKEIKCCECGKLERSCTMALKARDTHRSNTWGSISLEGSGQSASESPRMSFTMQTPGPSGSEPLGMEPWNGVLNRHPG